MNEGQEQFLVVFSTAPTQAAGEQLAEVLVERRVAACVQVVSGVSSFYRWQGTIQRSAEVLLLIKTASSGYRALAEALASLHPYEVPEIVAVAAERVDPAYARWMRGSMSQDEEER